MKKIIALFLVLCFSLAAAAVLAEDDIGYYLDDHPEAIVYESTWIAGNGDWRIEVYGEDGGMKLMAVHRLGDNKEDIWEYSAALDEDGKLTTVPLGLHYRQDTVTYDLDLTWYEDGDAEFSISEEGKLLWQDDMAETPDTVVFVQSDSMVNPWIYTDSREEAMEYSGVEFEPPIQEAIPEGYKYVLYAARDGVIRMIFTNGETELAISKSNSFSGLELSGDFREYSKNWEEHHKGVAIDCYGDGDTINLAYFGTTTTNFSVNVYDTSYKVNEGNGLTIDQLTSLISGMQP